MTNMLHELFQEFPEHSERMHLLRASNPHFNQLYNAYHEINQAVLRAEADEEPTSDDHLHELRVRRVQLKDEIYALLAAV